MLNVTNNQANANKKITRYYLKYQMAITKKTPKAKIVGKDAEKLKFLHIFGGNAKWCSCYRKEYGDS